MSDRAVREEALFHEVLLLPAEQRAEYLARACGDDSALRDRLHALLAAHELPGETLGVAAAGLAVARDEPIGTVVGRYKLLEKIGEGGFGAVYVAEQKEPVKRRVALKIIKLGMDTRQIVARFEAERQALALMDHPNIAKVFDAGATEAGRPYFVMELVRGIKITEYCDQHQVTTGDRLNLFIPICHAIQHAHQKGIIHRDIKPSNILITLHDGVPVPKVIDFGIAKATRGELTDKTVYTQLHQCIGTPAYMSPEQAEMSGLDVDTRSDIYSLGVLLYELLTGGTPFDQEELAKAGWDAMRRTIREKEPLRPSTRLSKLPPLGATELARRRGVELPRLVTLLRGDLDWIVMKCLEKDRTRRYETATGLALDIARHVNHEPVTACPPSTLYRLRKLVRRNQLFFAAAGAVLAALVLGLVASTWLAVRATRAEQDQIRLRAQAETNERKARDAQLKEAEARRQAQRQTYSAEMKVAHEAYLEGAVARALTILRKHVPRHAEQEDLRGFEWRYLWRLCQEGDAIATYRGHPSLVASIALGTDDRLVTCDFDGLLKSVDLHSRREILSLQTGADPDRSTLPLYMLLRSSRARRVAVSENGEVAAASFTNGTVTLWQLGQPEPPLTLPIKDRVSNVVLSRDGRTLAIGSKEVRIWRLAERRETVAFPTRTNMRVEGLSPDGRLLSAVQSLDALVWDVTAGRELWHLERPHTSIICHTALAPDGRTLATASYDTTIKLWDIAAQKLLATLVGHQGFVWRLAFSPDGRTLASGSSDQTVKLWDVGEPERAVLLRTLRGHTADVTSLAFSPSGATLASGDATGATKVWRVTPDPHVEVLTGHSDWVFAVAFSPDGSRIASAGFDGTIRLWDLANGQGKVLVPTRAYDYFTLEFSPDGKTLVTGENFWRAARQKDAEGTGTVHLWDVTNGSEVFRLPIDPAIEAVAQDYSPYHGKMGARCATFSKDGRLLACGDTSGWIRVLSVPGMTPVTTFHAYDGMINGVQFSPDRRWLATVGRQGTTKIFDTETWKEVAAFVEDSLGAVGTTLAFSPDSKWLATGSQQLKLWDTRTRQIIALPGGHSAPMMGMCFAPDGKTIATGSWDHSIKLWSMATRQEVATLRGHTGLVSGLAFSPDGTILASSSEDKTIRLWRAISATEATRMQATPPRD